MSSPSASVMVSVSDHLVWVKICGRANFAVSMDFKRLITELRQRGHRNFVLELGECLIMDSTFLGVLARLSMDMAPAGPANGDCAGVMELVNPTGRVAESLENLGVLHLFRIARGKDGKDLHFETIDPVSSQTSKLELSRNCLEAHRTLMSLSPENMARFKDVATFLAEDIEKLEAQEQPV